MYLADLRGTDQCWLHGGSGSMVAFSLFLVRSLVYVFYMTGGPRDLMPYIPTGTIIEEEKEAKERANKDISLEEASFIY
jgi:hypothetical protein